MFIIYKSNTKPCKKNYFGREIAKIFGVDVFRRVPLSIYLVEDTIKFEHHKLISKSGLEFGSDLEDEDKKYIDSLNKTLKVNLSSLSLKELYFPPSLGIKLVPLPINNIDSLSTTDTKFIREGKTNFFEKSSQKQYITYGDYTKDEDGKDILEIEKEVDGKQYSLVPTIYEEYEPTGEEMIEISYIYGPNRSGKTYYAAEYVKEWKKIFKDWPIYLFSRRDKDKILDDIEGVERVIIDESLITEPLSMTDFSHSLVIFDDVDTITNKEICSSIQKLRDDIMETGRQKMIYVINTSHLGMNYLKTRTVLNEANSYTLFPRKGNYEHNFKILQNKMGMKATDIRSIIDSTFKIRVESGQKEDVTGYGYRGTWGWVTIYKDSPQYFIYENGCKIL